MPRMTSCLLGLFTVCLLASCGTNDQPFRKLTVPVTGQVFVDGQPPSSPLAVACVNADGVDQDHPTLSAATTDEQGRFSMSTYVTSDGVPAGDYTLTFSWSSGNTMLPVYAGGTGSRGRPKSFKQRVVTFKAVEGQPVDMGKIDLTTADE